MSRTTSQFHEASPLACCCSRFSTLLFYLTHLNFGQSLSTSDHLDLAYGLNHIRPSKQSQALLCENNAAYGVFSRSLRKLTVTRRFKRAIMQRQFFLFNAIICGHYLSCTFLFLSLLTFADVDGTSPRVLDRCSHC